MPKCKNDPKRSYKGTEPSPKGLGYCAHSEKVGTKRKGKDGNQWIIKQVKTSKRWMKIKSVAKDLKKPKKTIKKIGKHTNKKRFTDNKKNNKTNINKLLKKKQISETNEEHIKNFLTTKPSTKKEIINKIFKKIYELKKKKQSITLTKNLNLYDEYSFEDYGEKIKINLDKGDYNIYVSNYIKNITSMIIIEKDEPFKLEDVKFVKNKQPITLSDSQKIVFEENNVKLYDFELEGRQFFGYNLTIYCGKIKGKIKIILIPIIELIKGPLNFNKNIKRQHKNTIKINKKLIRIPSYNVLSKYKVGKILDSINMNNYEHDIKFLKLKKNYTNDDIIDKLTSKTIHNKIIKKLIDYKKIPISILDYYKSRLNDITYEDIINKLLEYLHIQYNEKSIFDFDVGIIVINNKYTSLNEEGPRDYICG